MTKRILDEATRKALQGYTPFSCDATTLHTPEVFEKSNIPKEFHPVFKIRCLKQSELVQLKANFASILKDPSDTNNNAVSEANSQIIRACVLGWDNLYDSGTGDLIEPKMDTNGGVDKDQWAKLPVWIVTDLFEKVRLISGISKVDNLSLK